MYKSKLYIYGVKEQKNLESSIKNILLKSTNDLSWLSKGDVVLLKPALNSPDPYPATTDPVTIEVIARLLIQRGARVVIGDQSGIGHVLHSPNGTVKGSSKGNYEKSGMKRMKEIPFAAFEEEGWDKGFYRYKSDGLSWKHGFFITNWVKKVDHIINLPRLSTHVQAGVTLGFKNFVGLLREDSRLEFHMNGPFSFVMKTRAIQGSIKTVNDKSDSFFKKIVEISLAVKSKLRLTLLTATKAQVTLGPDKYAALSLFPSHVVDLDPGIIMASEDQVAVEICALSLLTYLYKKQSMTTKMLQILVTMLNTQTKELGTYSIWKNPFITHALHLNLGKAEIEYIYNNISDQMKTSLQKILVRPLGFGPRTSTL